MKIILIILFLIAIFLIPVIDIPLDNVSDYSYLYNKEQVDGEWDCSNIAATCFKMEHLLGHEVYLVHGQNWATMIGHAWVEDKNGSILVGGPREWLYDTFPDRIYMIEIPNHSEWDTI